MTRNDLRKIGIRKIFDINEIANKANVTPRAIYYQIEKGLPTFDMDGKTYIYGEEFRQFHKDKRKQKFELQSSEFFCTGCRHVVIPQSNFQYNKNHILAKCPLCNRTVSKFVKKQGGQE